MLKTETVFQLKVTYAFTYQFITGIRQPWRALLWNVTLEVSTSSCFSKNVYIQSCICLLRTSNWGWRSSRVEIPQLLWLKFPSAKSYPWWLFFSLIFIQTYDQLAKYVFVLHNHIQRLTGVKKTCKKEIFTVPLSYERGVKKKRRTTT